MNKRNLHKILSDRFEREAESGFHTVPGSEAYFNELENPFTQKKYAGTGKLKGNLRFLLLEIGLMSALLLFLKFGWTTGPEQSSLPPKKQVSAEMIPQKTVVIVPVQEKKSFIPVPKTVRQSLLVHLRQKSFMRPIVQDSAGTVALVAHVDPENTVTDSTPVTAILTPVFHYSDNRSFYQLHYLADILVIDYGDSVSRMKLSPILNGVPANLELSANNKTLHEKPPVYQTIKQNLYLEKLEKGMKAFRSGEWKKAREVFNLLYTDNAFDQNALFYGALCRYEKGDYQEAIDLLGELKQIPQPIFEQDADYYLALAFMKNGNTSKALEQLKKIAASDSFYREKAAVLLQELR